MRSLRGVLAAPIGPCRKICVVIRLVGQDWAECWKHVCGWLGSEERVRAQHTLQNLKMIALRGASFGIVWLERSILCQWHSGTKESLELGLQQIIQVGVRQHSEI